MDKEIFILNKSNDMYSKENINKLIVEINKLKISKNMKKFLLVASLNLLSSIKTQKALEYQLQTFKKQGRIIPEKTRSKYINKLLNELNELPESVFKAEIDGLIQYITSNNVTIKA